MLNGNIKTTFHMFLRLPYTFTGILCKKNECAVLTQLSQTIYQFKGSMYVMGKNGFALVFFYHKRRLSQNP